MNPEYLSFTFDMKGFEAEIWLALLSEWPFESFHEENGKVTGYIQQHDLLEKLIHFIEEHKGVHFLDYQLSRVEDKNWNEVWESSFNPVAIDHFCYVHAEFHSVPDEKFRHHVLISPKMAFGTGHHATTFMMIRAMKHLSLKGKTVLDYGCGTGILSVVAAMEGATSVIGVDIQEEAIENSREHAKMNGVEDVCRFYLGGLEKASGVDYDIILANINRNVILENLNTLSALLDPQGTLLISGIMNDDLPVIEAALSKLDLETIQVNEKDQWLQLAVRRVRGLLSD
jgi:ribosomal protein L11 methyltransferase